MTPSTPKPHEIWAWNSFEIYGGQVWSADNRADQRTTRYVLASGPEYDALIARLHHARIVGVSHGTVELAKSVIAYLEGDTPHKCPACDGYGVYATDLPNRNRRHGVCDICSGTGIVWSRG